jgi:hypothetical protein
MDELKVEGLEHGLFQFPRDNNQQPGPISFVRRKGYPDGQGRDPIWIQDELIQDDPCLLEKTQEFNGRFLGRIIVKLPSERPKGHLFQVPEIVPLFDPFDNSSEDGISFLDEKELLRSRKNSAPVFSLD